MNKHRYSINQLLGTVSGMQEKFLLLNDGATEENAVMYWLRIKAEADRISDEAALRIAEVEKQAH